MSALAWPVLALVAGLGVIWIGVRRGMPRREPLPDGVVLPTTLVQRVSGWALLAGLLLSAGAAGVVVANGPDRTYAEDGVRLLFTLLVLAAVFVVGGVAIWLGRQGRDTSELDERDRAILARAPAVQGGAMLVTLAVWVIGLMERFHDAGAVPVFYLNLVFWSCLLVNLLALPVGVLAGYRRS